MTDKEKVALSVAGGLATVVIGYLVWRHERTVTQADSAAQLQAQNAANDQYAQELEAAVSQQIPTASIGGGASNSPYDTGTTANITPAAQDSNIAAILAAFFGNQNPPTDPTGTGTIAPVPQPRPSVPGHAVGPIVSTRTPVGVPAPPNPTPGGSVGGGVAPVPRPLPPTIINPNASSVSATGSPVTIPTVPRPNPPTVFRNLGSLPS